MGQTKEHVRLECTSGNHYKFYEIWIETANSGYVVNFSYGRIGTVGVTGTKTSSAVTWSNAIKKFTRLVDEKLAKGYKKASSAMKKPILLVKPETFTEDTVEEKPKPKKKPKKATKKKAAEKDDDEPKRSLIL